ncbi:MAG TPA: response regulator [Armatimonadota bacterium]|nr:response regulator [Armatimonadota bacterium]
MKLRVLFVDDEPNVLQGLRRMLRPQRDEWDMDFSSSGAAALAAMRESPYDVIVCDMRMPGMDGAQVLAAVRDQFPGTTRIILSGQSDDESVMRTVGPAHQFLSKPCDPSALRDAIARAQSLRRLLRSDNLLSLVGRIDVLPPLPRIYTELVEVLQSPGSSAKEVAYVVSKDVGMAAKILQLVNSAFFGLPRRVTNMTMAVSYLGNETIRALVLTASVFSQLGRRRMEWFPMEALWNHCILVGAVASRVCTIHQADRPLVDDAMLAGSLHDVGRLVLAVADSAAYKEAMALAAKEQLSAGDAEARVLGATHAEAGAYLMGLWGLPDPVVEAVAYHHRPAEGGPPSWSPLAVVHVADVVAHEAVPPPDRCRPGVLDQKYVAPLGVLETWHCLIEEFRGLVEGDTR